MTAQKDQILLEKYYKEQLDSQRGMLTSAIEALAEKNSQLESALTKVRSRNYELDQISYRTYHDMRGPMVTLLGVIELLRSEFESDQADYLLNQAVVLVNRLDNFSQSLSDYVTAIQKDFEYDDIKTKAFFEELDKTINAIEGRDKVSINFCNESIRKNPAFSYDKEKLITIIRNLVINSIRYRDIDKDIQKVDVVFKVKPKNTIISVRDNGMGISKDVLGRVTNMFYRGTELSKGSGLGLYVVKTLLNETSGTLKIFSKEGVGTDVTIILPSRKDKLTDNFSKN